MFDPETIAHYSNKSTIPCDSPNCGMVVRNTKKARQAHDAEKHPVWETIWQSVSKDGTECGVERTSSAKAAHEAWCVQHSGVEAVGSGDEWNAVFGTGTRFYYRAFNSGMFADEQSALECEREYLADCNASLVV